MPPTLLLTRSELQQSVDLPELVGELRSAMTDAPGENSARRVREPVGDAVTAMVLFPGLAGGVPAYTVKVHAKNPGRRPAITGVIALHDLTTGDLLAVMDSGWLTAVRTAAGAALGTTVLARADAAAVGVIGAGRQGRATLRALLEIRALARVDVHDIDVDAAQAWAADLRRAGVDSRVRRTAGEVASGADVVLVATWSRTPVLSGADLEPGIHVTSVGADEPDKTELDLDGVPDALVVTDDAQLAADVLPRTDATLGAVLRGEHPGRTSSAQVSVYSPVGLPLQDAVVGWHAYCRAREAGRGTVVDLEG